MKNSKIVVSTSLSTSYLETLSMNIPTIVVTNFELEPVRAECKKYLELLIESKILHLNPRDLNFLARKFIAPASTGVMLGNLISSFANCNSLYFFMVNLYLVIDH